MLARLLRELGWMNLWLALAMLLPSFVALGLGEQGNAQAFFTSAILTAFAGLGFLTAFQDCMAPISRRSAFLLPINIFVFLPVFASLPFIFSPHYGSFSWGYFEAVSALTTTGASVIIDPAVLGQSILLWRGMLEWIGGFFTILIALSVLSFLNVGGMQLIKIILPHGSGEGLLSQMGVYAKAVMPIYAGLTFVSTVLLVMTGENWLDALTISFTLTGTGGFSLYAEGQVLHNNPNGELIVAFVLIAASASIVGLLNYMRFKRVQSTDKKEPLYLVLFTIVGAILFFNANNTGVVSGDFLEQVRVAFFQAATSISTSGLNPEGGSISSVAGINIIMVLIFIGGMATSSTGGVKIMRIIILFRHAGRELKRLAHKHDATTISYDGKTVDESDVATIWLLFFTTILTMGLASLIFSFMGYNLHDAFGITVSSLMNAGPAVYSLAPGFDGYQVMPVGGFGLVVTLMILGRMELVFALALLSKRFWVH